MGKIRGLPESSVTGKHMQERKAAGIDLSIDTRKKTFAISKYN